MKKSTTFLIVALLAASPAALAQHGGGHHQAHGPGGPYAGFQAREAASVSAEEAADLRAARGMGLALPAEVNGYPGPLHALELADRLGLDAAQRASLAMQIEAMRREAIPLGEAVITAERALDALFRAGMATVASVDAAAYDAAAARGRLRAAHLRVHLLTRETLTASQRPLYARLRGYAD